MEDNITVTCWLRMRNLPLVTSALDKLDMCRQNAIQSDSTLFRCGAWAVEATLRLTTVLVAPLLGIVKNTKPGLLWSFGAMGAL